MTDGRCVCQFVPKIHRKNGTENARNPVKCVSSRVSFRVSSRVSFRVSFCVSNDQKRGDFECFFKAKNSHFSGLGAGSVPVISCVIPCVIYVSRNGGESGKKRKNMTHLKCKRPCKSIIYKVLLCPGLDSNQHTFRRCYLKAVRLPISPPGHLLYGGANISKDQTAPKKVPFYPDGPTAEASDTASGLSPTRFAAFHPMSSTPMITSTVPITCSAKIGSPSTQCA